MHAVILLPLFGSLAFFKLTDAQTCAAAAAPFLGCPSGRCDGRCVAATYPAGGPGALTCAVAGGGAPAACNGGFCVTNRCLDVSTDLSSCNPNPCAGTARCVNGECLTPNAAGGCAAPACTPDQICYTGCVSNTPDRGSACSPPCTAPGLPVSPAGTAGQICNQICLQAAPACPAAAATAVGTCVAAAAPGGCAIPCGPGTRCVTNACVKKTTAMCAAPCTPTEECIFGTCVAKGACAAGTCNGPDDACVSGCVPSQAAACAAPCAGGTPICVPGCTAGGGGGPPQPPRCEDAAGTLLPTADVCDDEAPVAECTSIFKTPGAKRPTECDLAMLAYAAKRCAKTCKICCELPAYSCQDPAPPAGAPTCAQNKAAGYCTNQGFRPLMQQTCPATCGLCQSSGTAGCADKIQGCYGMRAYCNNVQSNQYMKDNCAKTCRDFTNDNSFCAGGGGGTGPTADTASNCQQNANLCNNQLYYQIMTTNCCRTCNRCGGATGGGGGTNPSCVDTNPACVSWNQRGFCQSTFYTDAQKRQYCSKTCRYC